MLINYVQGEECRIALLEDGKLEEYYQERASAESHVGNIYKGRVTNVESSIQAAFVDFGLERNGFLHISDVHPQYFPGKDREEFEKVGSKTPRRDRPPIQRCFKRGQEVLVQVLKEGISSKGPTITSYLSIPGRFIVMMPQMERLGVSRKVDDDQARREARDILKDLNPPEGFGFIVRTQGVGQTKTDLKRDLAYLQRLWKTIERKRKSLRGVGELYAESDLMIRTIRDVYTTDIERVVIDDLPAAQRCKAFMDITNPRSQSQVVYYDDPAPLFHRFGVEPQIDTMNSREAPLPSGGSLVIDQTEALVAIDVNSGKSRDARDAETNAYRTNQEAVDEICRQLRLRDLGGVVVLDLIDMMQAKHRKAIETQMRNNLKKDRARTRIGPISQFGLLEMTRQRMRPSLRLSLYKDCDHCAGLGMVKTSESVVLSVLRRLAMVLERNDIARVELTISPDVAFQLLNRKRHTLVEMEQRGNKPVMVRVGGGTVDFVEIAAFNDKGGVVASDIDTNIARVSPKDERVFKRLEDAVAELDDLDEDDDSTFSREAPRSAPASDTDADDDASFSREAQRSARETPADTDNTDDASKSDNADDGDRRKKRRRRRRRRGKGGGEGNQSEGGAGGAGGGDASSKAGNADDAPRSSDQSGDESATSTESSTQSDDDTPSNTSDDDAASGRKRKRRRRGGRSRSKRSADVNAENGATDDDSSNASDDSTDTTADSDDDDGNDNDTNDNSDQPKPKRRRRRGTRGRGGRKNKPSDSATEDDSSFSREAQRSAPDSQAAAPNGNKNNNANTDTKSQEPRPSRGYSNTVVTTPRPDKSADKPADEPEGDDA